MRFENGRVYLGDIDDLYFEVKTVSPKGTIPRYISVNLRGIDVYQDNILLKSDNFDYVCNFIKKTFINQVKDEIWDIMLDEKFYKDYHKEATLLERFLCLLKKTSFDELYEVVSKE